MGEAWERGCAVDEGRGGFGGGEEEGRGGGEGDGGEEAGACQGGGDEGCFGGGGGGGDEEVRWWWWWGGRGVGHVGMWFLVFLLRLGVIGFGDDHCCSSRWDQVTGF